MSFGFEKLLVYQKAVAFADSVCTLTKGFPRGYFFLADRKNFFGIAGGCVQECFDKRPDLAIIPFERRTVGRSRTGGRKLAGSSAREDCKWNIGNWEAPA